MKYMTFARSKYESIWDNKYKNALQSQETNMKSSENQTGNVFVLCNYTFVCFV